MNSIIPSLSRSLPRVIVTGGAGFIGSHLVDLLLQAGHQVLAIDNLSTGSLQNLKSARKSKNFTFIPIDVCTFNWENELTATDVIVHLASTVGVLKVCEDAIATADNNHLMLETILKAALKQRNRLLYASTSEVYGETRTTSGSKETDPLQVHVQYGGRSAYTLSKVYGEMKCMAHLQQDQLPVTIMRFFNTTGPRQSAAFGMVAPRFIEQALKGQAITVYGTGKQTRSFCSVFDTARAIQQLMNQPAALGIFNIGNPEAITIEALAKYVIKITGSSSSIQYLPLPPERIGQSDILFRKPDISTITKRIGWKPNYTWQQTLQTLLPQTQTSAK